jgi:peptide/nickel transport system substrate-binding protein
VPKGEFTLGMFGDSILPDTSLKNIISSKEIPTKENAWTGGNITRIRNSKLDEKLAQFDQEWDRKKRVKLVREMEEIILQEKPSIPLYHRKEGFVMPAKMEGFVADVHGLDFVFPENWH